MRIASCKLFLPQNGMVSTIEDMGTTLGNENSTTTVTFNVGGKLYEVSRSLLEVLPDTSVLVKKSSEAASSPIFIDRDPDRFAYCLDYMRDNGRVFLAENVSKDALMEELKFFGFDDVDDSRIMYDDTAKRQTAARFQTIVQQSLQNIADMKNQLESLKQKIETEEVALYCFRESTKSVRRGDFSIQIGDTDMKEKAVMATRPDNAHFSECIEKYGLEYIYCQYDDRSGFHVKMRIVDKEGNNSDAKHSS